MTFGAEVLRQPGPANFFMPGVYAVVRDVFREGVKQVAKVMQKGRHYERFLALARSARSAHCSACSSCETCSPK